MFENIDIKKEFYLHFNNEMEKNKTLTLFYEILTIGKAYVVGGFFRDFLLKKQSRDIDVIVDIPNNELIKIVSESNFTHTINRHGGLKIIGSFYDIDIWTIENNWAFKQKIVKLNNDDQLNSIARGCFYNYDSLVINISNFSYNIKYFTYFLTKKELDILLVNSKYKNLNPSIEANILRAVYLKKTFDIHITNNTYYYLYNKIGYIKDKYSDITERLMDIKETYIKYDLITKNDIEVFIRSIYNDGNAESQLTLFV